MGRKFKLSVIIVIMITFFTGIAVFANNNEKLNNVQNKLNKTKHDLREGKKKEKNLTNKIIQIQGSINKTEANIQKLEGSINVTAGKVSDAQRRLAAAEANVASQKANLEKRLRSMYMNDSGSSIIEVVLGSASISDFIDNMEMVKKIYMNDAKILNKLKDSRDAAALEKRRLASLQYTLKKQQQQHETQKRTLAANKSTIMVMKNQVAKENQKLAADIDALNREANRITAEIRRLQSSGTKYTGGVFMWPVNGKISSPFGYRIHPILKERKLHTGIDISAPHGTPVRAANTGVVIKAGPAGSYGNMVMVDHGGGIVTLYAHNSSLAVGTGASVQKGQVISYVGSTGSSTGNHLHFEVRVNGEYKNPMGWL